MTAAEFLGQIFHIILVAKHFLPLEDDGTHLIGGIQLFQEKVHIIFCHMGFVSRTQYHIESMGSCIFHGFSVNTKIHLHEFVINRIDFQGFHAVNFKGPHIIPVHKE